MAANDPSKNWDKIGAGRAFENPNDPRLVGEYKDVAAELSPDQKSVLQNFPMGPAPSPFKGSGG